MRQLAAGGRTGALAWSGPATSLSSSLSLPLSSLSSAILPTTSPMSANAPSTAAMMGTPLRQQLRRLRRLRPAPPPPQAQLPAGWQASRLLSSSSNSSSCYNSSNASSACTSAAIQPLRSFVTQAKPATAAASAKSSTVLTHGLATAAPSSFASPPDTSDAMSEFDTSDLTDRLTAQQIRTNTKRSIAYFQERMERVDKPSALQMLPRLDNSNLLGVNTKLKGVSTAKTGLYQYRYDLKLQHPFKVILMRVGEFFETMGYDAVLLVQHAGLNPMGSGGVPRAGCPRQNLRRTIEDLVGANLSVVVVEEVSEPREMVRLGKTKQRFVSGVVTPALPVYTYGLLDEGREPDYEPAPPIVAIAAGVRGYSVCEVWAESRQWALREGITAEAVIARLHANGFSPPLRLHASLFDRAASVQWQGSALELMSLEFESVRYGDPSSLHHVRPSFHEELRREIKEDLSLEGEFMPISVCQEGRPSPLHVSTAQEIGIPLRGRTAPGVPPLVASLLRTHPPSHTPALCTRYLERLVLSPPPYDIADAIQDACRSFQQVDVPVPDFPCYAAPRLVQVLKAREASASVFVELAEICDAVRTMLETPALRKLGSQLLKPTVLETGIVVGETELLAGCFALATDIAAVVPDVDVGMCHRHNNNNNNNNINGSSNNNMRDDPTERGIAALDELFASSEKFRGQVRRDVLADEYANVARRAQDLVDAVQEDLLPMLSVNVGTGKGGATKLEFVYDNRDSFLALKGKMRHSPLQTPHQHQPGQPYFVHPDDRFGKPVVDRWTTLRVQDCLLEYLKSTDEAHASVKAHLRQLACKCDAKMAVLVTASMFCIIAKALRLHVDEAIARGWCLPELRGWYEDVKERRLKVEGLTPYWMDRESLRTVENSFDIEGMVLLTGANMAGKSTIARSTCALALLANCGLFVPASSAAVPRFDAFFLRKGSAVDSPAEAKSTYAEDCKSMGTILRNATGRSLVFVDEFGNGTEVTAGTAIAAGALQKLDEIGCMGIFATHLHGLLSLPMKTTRLKRMAMEIEEVIVRNHGSRARVKRRPTWRIIEGESCDSLAFECAQEHGMPDDVLRSAEDFYSSMVSSHHTGPQLTLNGHDSITHSSTKPSTATRLNGFHHATPTYNNSLSNSLPTLYNNTEASTSTSQSEDESSDSYSMLDAEECMLRVLSTSSLSTVPEMKRILSARHAPPPQSRGASCVYLLHTATGKFYCGETDDLAMRLKTHAKSRLKKWTTCTYIALSDGDYGKSSARQLEKLIIQELLSGGLPVMSKTDGRHRSFGSALRTRKTRAQSPSDSSSPSSPSSSSTSSSSAQDEEEQTLSQPQPARKTRKPRAQPQPQPQSQPAQPQAPQQHPQAQQRRGVSTAGRSRRDELEGLNGSGRPFLLDCPF